MKNKLFILPLFIVLLVLSLVQLVGALNCLSLPAITAPSSGNLFPFAPISSTASATFDFFIATTMTTGPQGMQSQYAVKITAGNPISIPSNSMFWWSGTLGILNRLFFYLPGASTAFCQVPVRPLFKQTRAGILKQNLHETAMDVAFTPNYVPSANTSFSFVLHGDPAQSYPALIFAGWKISMAFSEHRKCEKPASGYRWVDVGTEATASAPNDTALVWTVTGGVPQGIYAVCIKITDPASITSGWFPLAAANGHYRHNLVVGNIVTGPITGFGYPTESGALTYDQAVFFYAETKVKSSTLFNHFMLDSTLDVCSPYIDRYPYFRRDLMVPINASHVAVSDAAVPPAMQPGGGYLVLCASITEFGPWMLISNNSLFVRRCDAGQGFLNGACFTCNCNTAGDCNDQMTIDYTSKSDKCTCYSGFSGDSCEFADLPPPNASLVNETVLPGSRSHVVDFMTMDPNWEVHFQWSNGTTGFCSGGICRTVLTPPPHSVRTRISHTIKVWSRAVNGSVTPTSNRPTYVFYVDPATLSDSKSLSLTESATASSSNSETVTATVTRTPPPTPTPVPTKTRTIEPTLTKQPTRTRTRFPMNATICAAALNATPAVFQSPTTSIGYDLTEDMRCGQCTVLECSWGFVASCRGVDAFSIDLSYISLYPTPHCNVSFYDSQIGGLVNISLPISILPTKLTQKNLWVPQLGMVLASGGSSKLLRTSSTISIALLNYSVAPPGISFSNTKTAIQIRVCTSNSSSSGANDSDWYTLTVLQNTTANAGASAADILTEIPLPPGTASSVCMEVQISGAPFTTARYVFTLFLNSGAFSGSDNGTSGFIKGDAADLLVRVGQGEYLPPTKTVEGGSGAGAVSVELASSFEYTGSSVLGGASSDTPPSAAAADTPPSASTVSLHGISKLSDLSAATWAVLASSVLVGGVIIYAIFKAYKPKPRDNLSAAVNAMIGPADKM